MSETTLTESQSELAATNRELARRVLTLLGSEEQFDLWSEDVVMEFPYGPSLGQPARHEGKEAVVAYARQLTERVGNIKMRDMVFWSVEGHPDTVFIEYSGDVDTPGGHSYEQTYVNKMRFRDGLMFYMREFWDTKRIIDAANGVFDGQSSN